MAEKAKKVEVITCEFCEDWIPSLYLFGVCRNCDGNYSEKVKAASWRVTLRVKDKKSKGA